VSFGIITAHSNGSVDTSGVVGVDPDLIVKPFSRKGTMRSVREFTVNAFNQHHGMQAVERFGLDADPDQDGITNELSIGDITAVSVFQAALPVPVQMRPAQSGKVVARGQTLFNQVGCTACHIPALPLNRTILYLHSRRERVGIGDRSVASLDLLEGRRDEGARRFKSSPLQ